MKIEHDADKILRDLISCAEVAAKHSMENTGSFPPTIFIDGIEGRVTYSPPVKFLKVCYDDLAEIARECGAAYGAVAIVVAGEGWKVKTPHQRDNRVPDYNHSSPADCEEVVAFIGETRYEKIKMARPIIRSEDGKLLGMGADINILQDGGAYRHYADMLSKDFPDEKWREETKAELRKEGHHIKKGRERRVALFR
jgi:hypothetical protein